MPYEISFFFLLSHHSRPCPHIFAWIMLGEAKEETIVVGNPNLTPSSRRNTNTQYHGYARCQLQVHDTSLASCHVRTKRYSLRYRIHIGTMVRVLERGSSLTCPSRPYPPAVMCTSARRSVGSSVRGGAWRKGAMDPGVHDADSLTIPWYVCFQTSL
jgi:hypothetical protein